MLFKNEIEIITKKLDSDKLNFLFKKKIKMILIQLVLVNFIIGQIKLENIRETKSCVKNKCYHLKNYKLYCAFAHYNVYVK